MNAVVFSVQAEADSFSLAMDARKGYPKNGVDVGDGYHAPLSQTQTLRHGDVVRQVNLPLWRYIDDAAVAAELASGLTIPASGAVRSFDPASWLRPVRYTASAAGTDPIVLFVGNSLTDGRKYEPETGTYPYLTMQQMPAAWGWANLGFGGQTTPEEAIEAPAMVDAQFSSARAKNIVSLWEIGNDLATGTPQATAYQTFVSYCNARRATGFRVVILTITPRQADRVPAGWDADRAAINTLLRNNWTTFADAMADVAGIVALQNTADASIYPDGVHMTAAGYQLVANSVATAIQGLP